MLMIKLFINWVHKFWIPLIITVAMLATAVSITLVLLNKDQVTVQIANVPVHRAAGMYAPTDGVLKKGEHLVILKREAGWYQVRREDESKGWVAGWLVNRQKQLTITPLSEATIVLDPGHGGSDSGALSTSNKEEKAYTLQLALKVRQQLEKTGARVYMTRSTDKTVYLSAIPQLGERLNADAEISFHYDSAPEDNTASGYTSYYYHKTNGSKELAADVNQAMAPHMPLENRGVEYGDYLVLRDNTRPAILLENGYINSDKDFSYIKKASYQETIAKQIPVGLNTFFADQLKVK